MALTQAQIDAFESKRLSFFRSLGAGPQLLRGEKILVDELQVISDQLSQLVGVSVAPVGGQAPIFVRAPLDYDSLIESLVAGGVASPAIAVPNRKLLDIDPGDTQTITIATGGQVYLFVGEVYVGADPHSGSITTTLKIDSHEFPSLPMNRDFRIKAGFLPPAFQAISVTMVNGYQQVVNLDLDIQAVSVAQGDYSNTILPVMQQLLRETLGLSASRGGGS